MIQQLIYINELLKGREITKVNEITGKQEDELPTNINSYILIVASIMIEDNADLTYGLANVSNEEKLDFISNNLIEIQLKFDDDNETNHQIIKSLRSVFLPENDLYYIFPY